ncbi:MAG: helix-turn-helix domain-containing protein [Planctomycetota bacterium]|jgi:transposase-like protein
MGKRSGLGVPERREAVLSLIRRDEAAAVIARRFGVSEQTLYRWRDDFLAGGEAALAAKKNGKKVETKRIRELTRDLAERDRVIGELTIANRILKKGGGSPY